MTEIMTASHQWATRPADERFISLQDMGNHARGQKDCSREVVVPTKKLTVEPEADHKGLAIKGPNGHGYAPSHLAFSQLCNRLGAPAHYLRDKLPSPLVADCLNWSLLHSDDEAGLLLEKKGTVRCVTGPRYGRIWDCEIIDAFRHHFEGTKWKVPGEFGKAVSVTNENTTLYRGDRDMFIFLADEDNRIEVPNRRNGQTGTLARGIFGWNSEVGHSTFGLASFLFDYVCMNRIIWGATEFEEVRVRHTVSAPDRWIEELKPAIKAFSNASTVSLKQSIADARNDNLKGKVEDFMASRFGKRMVPQLQIAHQQAEERPIENRWDVVVAATEYAKTIDFIDIRTELERVAGKLLVAA
jgi:hypothetical protein